MITLIPCPFCAAPMHEDHVVHCPGDLFHVTCPVCICTGPLEISINAAIRSWNTRSGVRRQAQPEGGR